VDLNIFVASALFSMDKSLAVFLFAIGCGSSGARGYEPGDPVLDRCPDSVR
jgi:hypothetical protein